MDKIMKSQIVKLLLIAILVVMTPLISSSQRTSYLYFIVNLLIISLGVDAGLISFFSKHDHKNNPPSISPPHSNNTTTTSIIKQQKVACDYEKIVGVKKDEVKLQKSPSKPSLFFIGSGDEDCSEVLKEEEEEEEISEQELFDKAETFIGNFYNQLKMQRQESVESFKEVKFASELKIGL